jgi:GH25 family lysozyme M1 (1,4-beta-N-acetylmuramidase)
MLGIDYASIDGNQPPDFAAAYKWGIRFMISRAAYPAGGKIAPDSTVARDRAAANAAGLQFGAYLFLGYNIDPADQVAMFVNTYGPPVQGDLPPSLDVEFPGKGISDTGLSARAALDRIEAALAALQATYPVVMIYTSARVWQEDLKNLDSDPIGRCPGWIKVAYPWKAGQNPHPENIPSSVPLPPPMRAAGAAGCFIEQFQGDAVKVPGFTSTVDLDVFKNYVGSTYDARTPWIAGRLGAFGHACDPTDATSVATAIRAFQTDIGTDVDGIVGPHTWARLCGVSP